MDVLKQLFEQHYRLPAEHVQPLQGQLGGSGRAIVRLTGGGFSAIGIRLSGARGESSPSLSSHGIFAAADCRFRRFMPRI